MNAGRIEVSTSLDEFVAASERLEHWPTMISTLLGTLRYDLASQGNEQTFFVRTLRDIHQEHLEYAEVIREWIPRIETLREEPFTNTGNIQSVSAHGFCLKLWRKIKTLISISDSELQGGPEDMQHGDLYFDPEWAARDWSSTQSFLANSVKHRNLVFDSESLEHGIRWERSRVVRGKGNEKPIPKSEPTNNCEENILDALREYGSLKGEALSQKAGYEYNGHFKGTLASMVKRDMIKNTRGRGYHLPESQDQGQD